MAKRKYTQRKRARQQEETRQRIVEATMKLHEEVGAARTTVSAVAREAGVQRLTVYRHFPDDAELLQACTSTWLTRNPPPAPETWEGAESPVRAAIGAYYGYYRLTEQMWTSSYRDVETVEALQEPMARFESFLDEVAEGLSSRDDVSSIGVVIRHGLRFSTWQSLTGLGLTDEEAADMVTDWVGCAEDRAG